MRITIETTSIREIEVLLKLLSQLDLEGIKIIEQPDLPASGLPISRGDKSIDPGELFGIWKENPRDIDEIRSKSWARNWS
ncbi:MAG: hypothetical protein H6558_15490 [Lewinellaceae bacterium]|nr:hypothetical protein [Lewinellaceae bacterium]